MFKKQQNILFMLLAHELTQRELVRRSAGAFQAAFDINNANSMIPSFLRENILSILVI